MIFVPSSVYSVSSTTEVEDEIEDPVTVTPSPTEKVAKPSAGEAPAAAPSSADAPAAQPPGDGAPSAADASAAQPSGDGSLTAAPSGEDAATVTPDQGADEVAATSEQDYTGPLEGEPDTDF